MIKDSVSLSFYLRTRSKNDQPKVYLRLIVSRQKSKMSIGHSLNPEEWDEVRQRVKKNKAVNDDITILENKIPQIKRGTG
jgi:hypothetical protein